MTALPKQRISRGRQGRRRAHMRLTAPALHECSQCHKPKELHHVCPSCGFYRGRKVIVTREEKQNQESA